MLDQRLTATLLVEGDQRGTDRRRLRLTSQVRGEAEGELLIHNLSRTGMLVECADKVPAGSVLTIELPGGTAHSAEVVWADDRLFGVRFAKPLTKAQLSAALLRAEPQQVPRPIREPLTQPEAMARLREHWNDEPEAAPQRSDRKLPLGLRLWVIGGLGLTGWAVPAAAAWLFW